MTPVFLAKDVCDTGYAKTIGEGDCHLKMFVRQADSHGYPAIGFGIGKKLPIASGRKLFDIAFCIDENEWNGTVSTQLRVKDIR